MNRLWTPEMEETLRKMYPTQSYTKCAEVLNLTKTQVESKIRLLGLKKEKTAVKWTSKMVDLLTKTYYKHGSSKCMEKFGLTKKQVQLQRKKRTQLAIC